MTIDIKKLAELHDTISERYHHTLYVKSTIHKKMFEHGAFALLSAFFGFFAVKVSIFLGIATLVVFWIEQFHYEKYMNYEEKYEKDIVTPHRIAYNRANELLLQAIFGRKNK